MSPTDTTPDPRDMERAHDEPEFMEPGSGSSGSPHPHSPGAREISERPPLPDHRPEGTPSQEWARLGPDEVPVSGPTPPVTDQPIEAPAPPAVPPSEDDHPPPAPVKLPVPPHAPERV